MSLGLETLVQHVALPVPTTISWTEDAPFANILHVRNVMAIVTISEAASQFYNPEIKTYEVIGNDFVLYPEEH